MEYSLFLYIRIKMKVIKPNTLSATDGTFTRASVAYYWDSSKVMTEVAVDVPRFNYNPDTAAFEGIVLESAATNLLLNSTTLSTQSVAVSNATQYTISFYGTGTLTLSDAHTAVMVGTGTYKRTTLTFTSATTNLTATVTGTVSYAQLETGPMASSWMKTLGTSATRAADVTTGSGLIYTTVTDPNALWSNAATYSTGQVVRHGYRLYESLQDTNLNHQPDTSPTWWLNIGPDNMHAAFDMQVSTVSTATTKMTFVVKAGSVDSVALINMTGVTARMVMYDPVAGIVAQKVAGLSGLDVFDWYQYFFYDPLLIRTQVVFSGLSVYPSSYITIEIEALPSETVSVALAIFGLIEELGGTQYGASAGIIDYSIKDTDQFGNVTFIQRNFSKRLSAQVFVANSALNRVQRFLYSIRAVPSVWIGSDDPQLEEALVVYGFYKDFSTDIAYPSHSLCSLEIEGLT